MASNAATQEKTFSTYNPEQGKIYAQNRPDYHSSVYEAVLNQHTSTGGQLGTLLDVGCGPGMATARLGRYFSNAIGLDPSEGMIATARSSNSLTSTSEPIRYEISTAEDLGRNLATPVADSSIDLITVANAAHWFDMSSFWSNAARVLKPGGSVALWTTGKIRIHPSMPNAVAIQEAIDAIEKECLEPYFLRGNRLTRDGYANLPLPWTLEPPRHEFDKASFFRRDWGVSEEFFVGQPDVNLDTFEKTMATASPVTRWRQAHPEDVGTERDVLKRYRREIERLLHETGVQPGKEMVRGATYGVLLVVKKAKTTQYLL